MIKTQSIRKLVAITVLFAILQITMPAPEVQAQCPMCRMSAESNLKNGGTEGKGLNKGILFMLAMPYLLIGGIGFAWYRQQKKLKRENFDG